MSATIHHLRRPEPSPAPPDDPAALLAWATMHVSLSWLAASAGVARAWLQIFKPKGTTGQ